LALYASDLEKYSPLDIEKALMLIASVPRREGETAFPGVATILEAVRGVIRAKGATAALDAENARVAHFKAHPELYETTAEVKEFAAMVAAKFGMVVPR
jgi:hypothetical protein